MEYDITQRPVSWRCTVPENINLTVVLQFSSFFALHLKMGKDEVKKPLLSEQEPASSSTKSDLTARPDVKKVGCPKEIYPNEKRVAMTPSNVKVFNRFYRSRNN